MSDTPLTATVAEHEVHVTAGETRIATYVHRPEMPQTEAPKPYISPLRTLSGAVVSGYRPWDHRWHKGLQMTWSHLSGDNFWGGPSFDAENGYVWRDNLGTMRHEGFDAAPAPEDQAEATDPTDDQRVRLAERLTWISAAGQAWIAEQRSHTFHGADPVEGLWVLDFATELTNIRGEDLHLGSPTTHGRESAGYTGWFWRGPRSFTGCRVSTPGGEGAEIMGRPADWIAVSSEVDERDGGATLLFFAGTSSADVPIKWFVRDVPFAAVAPSPAFDREITLAPRGTLALAHRLVVVDRVCQDAEIHELAARFLP